jgi:type IV pilus assembly protein PilB
LLDTLMALGIVARETLVTVLSFQLRVPVVDLKSTQVDPEAVGLIPEDFARQHRILPIGFDPDGSLRIATLMPNDFQLSTQLSSMTGHQTKFALALSGNLDELISRTYATAPVQPAPQPAPSTNGGPRQVVPVRTDALPQATGAGVLGSDIGQMPAAQAVEMVTLQAVKRRASDIHMVPTSDSSKVLFRIDGALQNVVMVPLTLHESMVSRIKVLAEMDISEQRRSQDGSFSPVRREDRRLPCRHHRHDLGRDDGRAYLGPVGRPSQPGGRRSGIHSVAHMASASVAALRHASGVGAYRLGQDHHALRRAGRADP